MKILTRSFLADIVLVSLGCFTLVCVIGLWRETKSGRTEGRYNYTVEVERAEKPAMKFRVANSCQTEDQLRADLVQRLVGAPTPQVALVRWYQETSEFYAASVENATQQAVAASANSPGMSSTPGTFRTVAARQGTSGSPPEAAGFDTASAWRDYWATREGKAEAWLASYRARVDARMAALGHAIRITQPSEWMPPVAVLQLAILLSLVVAAVGYVWRLVNPPVSFATDGVTLGTEHAGPSEARTAAMCFRQSWVRIQQPMGVTLRGLMGWSIVLAAMVAVAMLLMFSLF
ncbi:hypothetical protein [Aporhodopirellula aestuarii]|uniref:DUF3592 domain-containing protein n=1 Tax=Aporhodopirellula aestuarii TaxID=2950107 RepID=A0ABT0U987_9BACT|nr:hypothetical protein [Aporhodopirellula aestuarii]MCM2373469.1 hypothetical protein [Aporhodopirellula aestuarii]